MNKRPDKNIHKNWRFDNRFTLPMNEDFKRSGFLNTYSYYAYYDRICEMAMSCFSWHNLPKTVDERYLEWSLFTTGNAVFFKDDVMDCYLALKCVLGGDYDVYGIPIHRKAYGENTYKYDLTKENSVIIFNNKLHNNFTVDIMNFARRLSNIDRTIDVNVNAQKTPIMILCDEKQRLTMKNLYMQYTGNEPVIYGDKSLNLENISVIPTKAEYIAGELIMLKQKIWDEVLTYLGISNSQNSKKERLIVAEAELNTGGISIFKETRLSPRQQACNMINEMFGLDISVEFTGDKMIGADDREIPERTEFESMLVGGQFQ